MQICSLIYSIIMGGILSYQCFLDLGVIVGIDGLLLFNSLKLSSVLVIDFDVVVNLVVKVGIDFNMELEKIVGIMGRIKIVIDSVNSMFKEFIKC